MNEKAARILEMHMILTALTKGSVDIRDWKQYVSYMLNEPITPAVTPAKRRLLEELTKLNQQLINKKPSNKRNA